MLHGFLYFFFLLWSRMFPLMETLQTRLCRWSLLPSESRRGARGHLQSPGGGGVLRRGPGSSAPAEGAMCWQCCRQTPAVLGNPWSYLPKFTFHTPLGALLSCLSTAVSPNPPILTSLPSRQLGNTGGRRGGSLEGSPEHLVTRPGAQTTRSSKISRAFLPMPRGPVTLRPESRLPWPQAAL